jgi:protein-disulfide isomerase
MSKILDVTELDHVGGPASAPVTMIEYGDFQCPHCRRAFPIVEELREQMGDTLRFVFRHFPLTEIHPLAAQAAEASEAAATQGKFWEMHHVLFERQPDFEIPELASYAEELGLDVKRFASEMAAGKYQDRVRADVMSGVRAGVNGTPTFFINGKRHDEPWDLEFLVRAVTHAAGAAGGKVKHGR